MDRWKLDLLKQLPGIEAWTPPPPDLPDPPPLTANEKRRLKTIQDLQSQLLSHFQEHETGFDYAPCYQAMLARYGKLVLRWQYKTGRKQVYRHDEIIASHWHEGLPPYPVEKEIVIENVADHHDFLGRHWILIDGIKVPWTIRRDTSTNTKIEYTVGRRRRLKFVSNEMTTPPLCWIREGISTPDCVGTLSHPCWEEYHNTSFGKDVKIDEMVTCIHRYPAIYRAMISDTRSYSQTLKFAREYVSKHQMLRVEINKRLHHVSVRTPHFEMPRGNEAEILKILEEAFGKIKDLGVHIW